MKRTLTGKKEGEKGVVEISNVACATFEILIFQAIFALKARAYIRICFTIASRPLLRVGER